METVELKMSIHGNTHYYQKFEIVNTLPEIVKLDDALNDDALNRFNGHFIECQKMAWFQHADKSDKLGEYDFYIVTTFDSRVFLDALDAYENKEIVEEVDIDDFKETIHICIKKSEVE